MRFTYPVSAGEVFSSSDEDAHLCDCSLFVIAAVAGGGVRVSVVGMVMVMVVVVSEGSLRPAGGRGGGEGGRRSHGCTREHSRPGKEERRKGRNSRDRVL